MRRQKFTVQRRRRQAGALATCGWIRPRWRIRPSVAEEGGNPQLAENFLRAAELATIDDEEVMSLYEALRPHRSTAERAGGVAGVARWRGGAARCAELVAAGRRRLCPSGSSALTAPGVVAGIDVGNHTTEIVLARVSDGSGRPASRTVRHPPGAVRESPNPCEGAAALLHRIEVDAGTVADELLLSVLRPVDTATAPIAPAFSPSSPVRSLRRPDASTPAGTGYGVGTACAARRPGTGVIARSGNRFRRRRHRLRGGRPRDHRARSSAAGRSSG